jgi:hypothetical protein
MNIAPFRFSTEDIKYWIFSFSIGSWAEAILDEHNARIAIAATIKVFIPTSVNCT